MLIMGVGGAGLSAWGGYLIVLYNQTVMRRNCGAVEHYPEKSYAQKTWMDFWIVS